MASLLAQFPFHYALNLQVLLLGFSLMLFQKMLQITGSRQSCSEIREQMVKQEGVILDSFEPLGIIQR